MFSTMLNKEIFDHFRSLRFTLGWLILFVLVITSVLLLSTDVRERQELRQTMDRATEDYISHYAHMNRIGYLLQLSRPIEQDEILFRGLDDPAESKSFFAGMLDKLFPELDLLYIISILLSLLALIFTYDAVCGERETGTLKLLHTTTISRVGVLLAKWTGAMIVICVPFIVLVLLAVLLGSFVGGLQLSGALMLDVGVITLAALLYTGVFCALGLLISASVKHSGTSILVGLFAWVVLVLAVPNVSPLLASQLSPIPSVNSVERETRALTDTIRDQRVTEATDELIAKMRQEYNIPPGVRRLSNVDTLIEAGIDPERAKQIKDDFDVRWREVIDKVNAEQNAKANAIREELARKIDSQQGLARVLSLSSPTPAFTYFATDIASVGLRAEEYLDEEQSEYGKEFREFLDRREKESSEELGRSIGFNEFIDLSGRPRYRHNAEAFVERFTSTMPYLAHLSIYALVVLILGVIAYNRYDLR